MKKSSSFGLVHAFFEAQAQQSPTAIAINFNDQLLTYRELDDKANQLARRLSEFALQPDDLVGICLERSPDLIVGLLGILKAGAAYLPLDPAYPLRRLSTTIEDAKPKLLLTKTGICDPLLALTSSSLISVLDMETERELIAKLSTNAVACPVKPCHLAYVIYTSGSTGTAKGVAIEHRNTTAFLEWVLNFFTPEQLSGVLASTSICFDLSVFEIFGTLAAGGTIVLTENALTLARLSQETQCQVSLINTVPSAAAALLKTQSIPTSVSVVNLAGEPLPTKVAQQLYQLGHVQQIYNLYGPSEDTTYSTVAAVSKDSVEPPSIGQPLPNTEIFLFDANLDSVPRGEMGEIFIRGPKLARGYLNKIELTDERFIQHVKWGRLYRTGDLGCWLPDGNLKYLGRIDHQVKVRGFRVELGEIESTMCKHPSVDSCVVVDRSTPNGSQLLAYIVPTATRVDTHVADWKKVWDMTYSQSSTDTSDADTFNTVGWKNRVTGLPFTHNEMQDWVEHTTNQVLSLQPRRVLEIGCGSGLLLFKIAPSCEHYTGIDVSAEAIAPIQAHLTKDQSLQEKVSLHCLAAHEISTLVTQFDVIIINSVVQYFPSQDYLFQVINDAIALLTAEGCLFIGDVRDASLLETFHIDCALYNASGDRSIKTLHQLVQQHIQQEHELLLNPAYFYALAQHIPGISVDIQLKRSQCQNELTQYRFDVFLHATPQIVTNDGELDFVLDWQEDSVSIEMLRELLSQQRPRLGRIVNIPNPRLQFQMAATHLLKQTAAMSVVDLSIAEFWKAIEQPTLTGIDPAEFELLGIQMSYNVSVHPVDTIGYYEARLIDKDRQPSIVAFSPSFSQPPSQPLVHEPHPDLQHQGLIQAVRIFLQQALPDYMVPQRFCCLPQLPLTLNGKIDRKALPDIGRDRQLESPYIAPQTPSEVLMGELWAELLECEVGIDDSFFDLGGHSLLAVQLLSQIEVQLGVSISLFEFLRCPTVRVMARFITCDATAPAFTSSRAIVPQEDAILDAAIASHRLQSASTSQSGILLTGATGFLGSFLLDQLLRDTSETIVCLVRSTSAAEGLQRLRTSLEQFSLNTSKLDNRVVVVPGDLTRSQFGLPSLEGLASTIHTIFHSGAEVNLMLPYEQLRSSNVVGTQEILRLAGLNSIPVHFISTIDILHSLCDAKQFSLRGHRPVDERSGFPTAEQVYGGYAQTKWAGECLMATARDRGIPTVVHRAGMLTGHSVTGAGPTHDLMARLILGMIHLKAAPAFDCTVNLIPIDFACQQIINGLGDPLHHIVYPMSVKWRSLIQTLNQLGFPVDLISHSLWQARVREECTNRSHPLTAIRPLLTDSFHTDSCQNVQSYLEVFLQVSDTVRSTFLASITVQDPSDLIRVYLNYFSKLKLLSEPRSKVFSR